MNIFFIPIYLLIGLVIAIGAIAFDKDAVKISEDEYIDKFLFLFLFVWLVWPLVCVGTFIMFFIMSCMKFAIKIAKKRGGQ